MLIISKLLNRIIFRKRLNFLNEYLYNEVDEPSLSQLQKEKMSKLLMHAYQNVPYYRAVLGEKGAKNVDFQSIPFLTKDIIKQEVDSLKSTHINKKRFIKNSTSGSSGDVTRFYSDAAFHDAKQALAIRAKTYTGWKQGEPVVILWGASGDIKKSKRIISRLINSKFILNTTILSSFKMTNIDMAHYYNLIKKKKPTLLIGYPSSLEVFSNYLLSNGHNIDGLKGVVCSGETLQDAQRTTIEKAFSVRVFNRYGCREVGFIAAECTEGNGLHIASDHIYLEVVNERGELCRDGELGEIVITDLDNYAFPLIRYRIGDLGVLESKKTCKCGRTLPLLKKVEGRVFDIIIGANGNYVPGNFFTLLRTKINGFNKFTVFQENKGVIVVKVEKNPEFSTTSIEILHDELIRELGETMNIQIEVVDVFPENQNGKHRWIVSNVSPYI